MSISPETRTRARSGPPHEAERTLSYGPERTLSYGPERPLQLLALLVLSLLAFPSVSPAAVLPPLGSAAAFAVLGATSVTNTGPTVVTGDLGVSPGVAVVGFPPGTVTGSIHTGVASNAGPAQADALIAYNNAAAQPCDADLSGTDLGGLTLVPGVYCFATSAQLTGTLTLDFLGNSNAVFIFQIGSTLTTASSAAVVTVNGAPSCHQVVWQVGSSATIGAATAFVGDVFAQSSITVSAGASVNGSLYALTAAVSLDDNLITLCSAAAICTIDADCIDDGNVCTDEVCDPGDPGADGAGCTHPDNTAACDDGLFCTSGDLCSGGICSGAALDCNDGNPCTGDACDEGGNACVHNDNTDPCDDGLFCTTGDTCSGGACGGTALDCSDGNLCTTDACNEAGDACVLTDNTAPCDDGLFCTTGDICAGGACAGAALACSDANLCTDDSCDDTLDTCVNLNNTNACDDSLFCTTGDLCGSGTCNGLPVVCDDGNACTSDSCDETADACTSASAVCGNGIVDAGCGEACDAPGTETCNNGVDDDGDGSIDCTDPECVVPGLDGCNDLCEIVAACVPIVGDPAVIFPTPTDRRAVKRGTFSFHGRMFPNTSVEPDLEMFAMMVSNVNGVIHRAELPPGALIRKEKTRFAFRASDPERVAREGGVAMVSVQRRKVGARFAYAVKAKIYGDFTAATLSRMTTQLHLGNDTAFTTANWQFGRGRWFLTNRAF